MFCGIKTAYGLGIYLGYNSILDFREKRISLLLSLFFFAVGVFFRLQRPMDPVSVADSLLPGFLLIGLSFATRQKIGVGDGIVMIVCGVFLESAQVIFLLMLSLLLSGIAGILLIAVKKASAGTQLPWVPFVFAAFLLTCLIRGSN